MHFYDLYFMWNLVKALLQKRPNSSVNYWQILCECRKTKQFISCRGNVFCARLIKLRFWKIFSQFRVNNFDTLLINGQLDIYESTVECFVYIFQVIYCTEATVNCIWWRLAFTSDGTRISNKNFFQLQTHHVNIAGKHKEFSSLSHANKWLLG